MKSLVINSLGLGVQSTALHYMSSMGFIERFDYSIFADTGKEKAGTTWYLENVLLPWNEANNGVPIIVLKEKDLYADLTKQRNSTNERFVSIPAYTLNEDGSVGMLRRQCTNEYKIERVDRKIRELYGAKKYERLPTTYIYKGISLDEIERLSVPQEKWKVQVYPFCGYRVSKKSTTKYETDMRMTRLNILNFYRAHNLIPPPKSACVFCPYMSDAAWYDMKVNQPEDFAAAVEVDRKIRHIKKTTGINNPVFLHESCKPLEEIEFKAGDPDLWHGECSEGAIYETSTAATVQFVARILRQAHRSSTLD